MPQASSTSGRRTRRRKKQRDLPAPTPPQAPEWALWESPAENQVAETDSEDSRGSREPLALADVGFRDHSVPSPNLEFCAVSTW